MTILTGNTQTTYALDTNLLTRIVDNKPHTIDLKRNNSIEQIDRLAHLDNETFKGLAQTQKELRQWKKH